MKTKNKNLLIALTMALVLFVSAALGVLLGLFDGIRALGNNTLTLIGGEISEEYILNDIIEIPAAKLSLGGETKDAEISVIKPDGERVRSAKVKLTEGGLYKAEYKALFSGKAKTVEKDFTVRIPLFSKTKAKTTWEYGVDDSAYQTGKEGVKVRLLKDDTLTYNDIIDLNKSNGQIIDFFLLPADGAGTKDLRKIELTLTDLHNSNVSLTIVLQCSNPGSDSSKWWFDWTYVLAGGQNQTPTGVEGKGTANQKIHVGNDWGTVTPYSFYGQKSNGSCVVGTESLNVSYNEAENAVYVGSTQIISLSDLKFFEEPWNGFTSGEVKMSIKGDDFSLGGANLMITRIGTNNLKGEYYVDSVAPEVTIDYEGYDANNLPKASKGLSYPVFNATAWDKIYGDVDVKTTVYYNYESQQRYQVDVKDGRFATDVVGNYTIEYVAYDGFKNEAKKLITVYCGTTSPDLSVEAVGDYAVSGGTGALIFPAEISYTGGTGVVKTYATAKSENSEEFVIDEGFRPEEECVYKIKLYAVDMLGKTATFEYDLAIEINSQPVFLDEPSFPRYFLEGYKYTLPTIPAYDYSSGVIREEIATTIAIKDGANGGEIRDLDSNVATFEADADGYATIIYKATGKMGSNTAEYKVKVIDGWRDISKYSIDMKKYFYGENINVTDNAESVKVSATQDTSYTFVNPVIAHRFETKFTITAGDFSCLQLVFEDSQDANIKFTVEIDKSNNSAENSFLRINGSQIKYRPWAGFYGNNDFNFMYDETNKTLEVDSMLKTAIKNADGSSFEGFTSGLIYVSVNVIGVRGAAEVAWKNFGGQSLSERDYDIIAPSIKLSADYDSKYSIGTTAEVYSALVADVLSPEVSASLTVRDPEGKIIKDINGLKLENVAVDQTYVINLEMYGSYSVKYTAMDWMECVQNYSFAILVVDDQAPNITLNDELKTEIKAGKKVIIPTATAIDNVDGNVSVYTYIVNPEGAISKIITGEKITFTVKGVYELRYMALDTFGNLNILYYTITVI